MAWQDRAYNSENMPGGPRLVFPMPSWLTLGLIVACLVIFIVQAATGPVALGSPLIRWGSLIFDSGRWYKQPWRWITYQYLHADGRHIFFNLITIYFFVPMLERYWGWRRTLVFYTLGGIAGGITAGVLSLITGQWFFLVGASGAILSVLGAVTAISPGMQVLAMMVIPITMRTLCILITIMYGLTVVGDRSLSDAAHLGGLAFGYFAVAFGAKLLKEYWPFNAPAAYELEELGGESYGHQLNESARAPRRRKISRRAIKKARRRAQQALLEQQHIDAILAKVSATGLASLTWRERRALHKATERQRKRDLEFSREG